MISDLISCVKELAQGLSLLSSDMDEVKIKRETGVAHAIKAATMNPLVAEELENIALRLPKSKGKDHAPSVEILKKGKTRNPRPEDRVPPPGIKPDVEE